MADRPFCDFLGITVPAEQWEALRLDVAAELDCIGMGVVHDEPRSVLWRQPGAFATGTVKADRVGKVWKLGISGSVCAGLRAAGRFAECLAAIGTRPHRVTRLDASLDRPEDAAPIVAAVTEKGRAGTLSLTRKGVQPQDVTAVTGVRLDGKVSGTVYVGPRRADARMVVYDKRHERACRKLPDVGPLTRYELRLRSRTGVTLHDAVDPESVFWHYASPDFLPRPDGVAQWVPGGTGYDLPKSVSLAPGQRLIRRVEASTDLQDLIRLADLCGPYGRNILLREIHRVVGTGGAGVSPALTALPPDLAAAELPGASGSLQ